MHSKTIAASACPASVTGQKYFKPRAHQRGVTLIELMVGIVIGLLTIAVAMGALMVSRGISGTVSDASELQQQAAYVFRVIGQQMRQAGSVKLELDAGNQDPTRDNTLAQTINRYRLIDPAAAVVFETSASPTNPVPLPTDALNGDATAVAVGYRNYKEPSFADATNGMEFRNCLGERVAGDQLTNTFAVNGDELRCASGGQNQPIARNVANFQVRYLVQTGAGTGVPRIQYTAAVAAADWSRVQGVEVCLVLYGNEAIDLPAGSAYTDCDGTTSVDLTTLTGARARRMHMVFRNVYQLRSQGLI